MRELRERGSTDVSPRRLALSRASDVHGAARLADAQKSVPFPRSSRRRARPPMTRARTPSRATKNVARTAGDARDARASSCDVCGRRRGRARDAMDPHTASRDSSNHHRRDRRRHQCDFSRDAGRARSSSREASLRDRPSSRTRGRAKRKNARRRARAVGRPSSSRRSVRIDRAWDRFARAPEPYGNSRGSRARAWERERERERAMSLASDEMNYLVYRYLLESGFTHSAFAFGHESRVDGGGQKREATAIPPGALISFVQKGLQYCELEANLNEVSDVDDIDGSIRLARSPAGRSRGGGRPDRECAILEMSKINFRELKCAAKRLETDECVTRF